jgi:hypothetical protein
MKQMMICPQHGTCDTREYCDYSKAHTKDDLCDETSRFDGEDYCPTCSPVVPEKPTEFDRLKKQKDALKDALRSDVLNEVADMLNRKDWFGEKMTANEKFKAIQYIRKGDFLK